MERAMRNAVIWILGAIVVLILALLLLPSFVPVDAYKERLIKEVDARTGRHLTIEGKVSLALLPRISLTAERVALSNAPGAAQATFASFAQLDAEIGLFPLLAGQIALHKLVLIDPVIALEIDAAG